MKHSEGETNIDEARIAENLPEQEILIQSVCETLVPKLVAEDIPLLFSLLSDVFPNVSYTRAEMTGLKEEIRKVCAEEYLVCGEGDEQGSHWTEKVKNYLCVLIGTKEVSIGITNEMMSKFHQITFLIKIFTLSYSFNLTIHTNDMTYFTFFNLTF